MENISPCQFTSCQLLDNCPIEPCRVKLTTLDVLTYALMIDTTDDGLDLIADVVISCSTGSTQHLSDSMSFSLSSTCLVGSTEVMIGGSSWADVVDMDFVLDDDRGYNFTLTAASSLNANCPIEDYEFSVASASIGRDEGLYRLE